MIGAYPIPNTERVFTRCTHEDGSITITEIMNNKYYTPEIEEFHFGFEYELIPSVGLAIMNFDTPNEKTEVKWATEYAKCVFGKTQANIMGDDTSYIKSAIKDNKVRVKYLDREDIESLGWEYNEKSFNFFIDIEYGKKYELKYSPKEGTVSINHSNKILLGTKYKEISYTGEGSKERIPHFIYEKTQLFTGIIKNKSELKRILKQIGI